MIHNNKFKVFVSWFLLLGLGICLGNITTLSDYESEELGDHDRNTTIIFVHDWKTKSLEKALALKKALVNGRDDVGKVLIADWAAFSMSPDFYNTAERFTPKVAADAINQLAQQGTRDVKKIECIGHGLGAHICGRIGKQLNQNGNYKLRKILGLNPIGPYFKSRPSERLSKGDAGFVEVWHTDKRYGIYEDIGDKDVYLTNEPELRSCRRAGRQLQESQCLHDATLDILIRKIEDGPNIVLLTEPFPEDVIAELFSPSGEKYATNDVEDDLHPLLLKVIELEPGNWTVKFNSDSVLEQFLKGRLKRETNTSPSENIKLEAFLSAHVLDSASETPLSVEAHLLNGDDAVIGARVFAEISSTDGTKMNIELFDRGFSPDHAKDDGIYTRYIRGNFEPGMKFDVEIRAVSVDNATRTRSASGNPFEINTEDLKPLTFNFEERTAVGSFDVVQSNISKTLRPSSIADLVVVEVDRGKRWCTLVWTAAGKESDSGTADAIEITAFTTNAFNGSALNNFTFDEEHVIEGSLKPLPSGSIHNLTIEVPLELWEAAKVSGGLDLYFTVRSKHAVNGYSKVSNIAPAEFGTLTKKSEESNGNESVKIILFASLIILLLGILYGLYVKSKKKSFDPPKPTSAN